MSGPFGSSQWMYASGGFYGFPLEQSLRFNDDDSAYLSRTPASAGNRKTWTWSGWVKRGNLGSGYFFSNLDAAGLNGAGFAFSNSNELIFLDYSTGYVVQVQTSSVFRDVSAWYHLVVKYDTTQSTASDRVKIYVNNVEPPLSVTTYPSLNYDGYINNTNPHSIGRAGLYNGIYFDGYMAEVNFIDGQALDPTSFGEFKSGVWVANEYTGSYGTNGFYLNFSDSANIGDDLSGNANDWTANNLVATDVVLDSPTNNFAVWNPIKPTTQVFKDGNLVLDAVANYHQAVSTIGIPENLDAYFELTWSGFSAGSSYGYFGVCTEAVSRSVAADAAPVGSYGINNIGGENDNGAESVSVFSWSTSPDGTVYGFAVDRTNNVLKIYRNGVYESGKDITIPAAGELFIWASVYDPVELSLNAGQAPFAYTPPADFLPLNTANLPDPVIDPAQDDVPSDYFNTVLYTGTGATQSITGVGFQPSWLWLKNRSSSFSHNIYDEVRGTNSILFSDTTASEDTITTDRLQSFDADGFTLGSATAINGSGNSLVAWNWLAGNGTSSNTDGSITSTVSVNQKAGFSVVGYTGTQANGTVGHGLGAAAKVVISKSRTNANGWPTLHAPSGNYGLRLNSTGANDAANGPFFFQDTAPTSSVFYVGANDENNTSGGDMIAYCFAEVEGYSKFGSYTGNGSTDGPFVYTGFRPALIITKDTDNASNWQILDNTRTPENDGGRDLLRANTSDAEISDGNEVDFLSNGFKQRSSDGSVNASGRVYIYMAFAEMPAKYSLGR